MSIDATSLPSELVAPAIPLVGFYGLDLTHNNVHKAVWDVFNSNRKLERQSINLKLLPTNYEFPISKPKRSSYEWYQPKGILKRNWMLKHLHVLPAVLVFFIELEWNDGQWTERQLQCALSIQNLKSALQERQTRICIVLLQKNAPLPPGEDAFATERAASLTTACGISNKLLFVLPYHEHFQGYAMRLESAFLDLAQSYYSQMAKNIRAHRDQLTTAHVTLKIRHQFKLAFFAEVRQDFSTAMKHYTQSYNGLDEIRITDANSLEVKVFAGFVNYKICRLMFKLKMPRDAISHFMGHMEKYKNRLGYKELLFEHYAWLSSQHSTFADLFCDAIRNGLPALQTQHPGMYYNNAAEYMSKRREAFAQSCAQLNSSTDLNNSGKQLIDTMSILSNEYFGVYVLKAGETNPDAREIFNVLCEHERGVNYSAAINGLLSQAMAQYKIYKCLRFRKKLAIDMADEYLRSGDHAKALTLYSLMLPDYREEKWMTIFSDVLLKTLRTSLLAGAVADYVSCSVEALSLKITHDKNERILVLENLWKVLHGQAPVPKNQMTVDIKSNWEHSLQNVKSPIHIDLNKITELFEICISFDTDEVKQQQALQVQLIIRSLTDVPLKLENIALLLTDEFNVYKLAASKYAIYESMQQLREQQKQGTVVDYAHKLEPDVVLNVGHLYRFQFATEAQYFLENTQLHAMRFETFMTGDKLSIHFTKNIKHTHKTFRHYKPNQTIEDLIVLRPNCCIAPTFHLETQTNICNGISMLVNEYFAVHVTLNNPHNVFLQHVGLNISVPAHLRQKVFLCTEVASSRQKLHTSIQMDLGEIAPNGSNAIYFYVFSLIETTVALQQKIWYSLETLPAAKSSNLIVMPTHNVMSAGSSEDNSPDNAPNLQARLSETNTTTTTHPTTTLVAGSGIVRSMPAALLAKNVKPVQIELLHEQMMRKSCDDVLEIKCNLEFNFTAQLYALNKTALVKLYRGERFLLRVCYEVLAPCALDILDSYFICEHNLMQSTYSFKGRQYGKAYEEGDKLEDVIMLSTQAASEDSQMDSQENVSVLEQLATPVPNTRKISRTETLKEGISEVDAASVAGKEVSTRVVYNRALEAVQASGNCRGYIKGVYTVEPQKAAPIFGVYCIKWRRHGHKEENESKFVVQGLNMEDPPLNIYCTIEERMFVKMPMTLKVVLKNPTCKVLHLTANLNISFADNFICSGHKQLDISLFACAEKTLVYNLYPLCVGWQNLPELTLEYNTHVDASIEESQNALLQELVKRSIPKKVFVLPPLKQQAK